MQEENKFAVEILASSPLMTYYDIKQIVDFSLENGIKYLTIPQCYLNWVKNYVAKKINISTLIDYPNGYSFSLNKINAIKLALKNGASEIDIAINHCELKSGNVAYVERELKTIRRLLRGRLFKLYFNINILNESEFNILCNLLQSCSVDYLTVDFNYDLEEFNDKSKQLKQRVGKKVKLKLLTNYNFEKIKNLNKNEFDGRICITK